MKAISLLKGNKKWFENLIHERIYNQIDDEKYFGIGAMGSDDEGYYTAGALVFSVESGSNGEEDQIAAIIKWLYVDENHRKEGAADAMMEELFRILDETDVEHLLVDLPMGEEYEILGSYLEAWGFDFGITDRYSAEVGITEALGTPVLSGEYDKTKVIAIKDVPSAMFNEAFKRYRESLSLSELDSKREDYDDQISSVYLSDNKILGMLLVKKLAKSSIETVLMRASAQPEVVIPSLMRAVVQGASALLGQDGTIRIECRNQNSAAMLAKLFPYLQPELIKRGYCRMVENDGQEDEEDTADKYFNEMLNIAEEMDREFEKEAK